MENPKELLKVLSTAALLGIGTAIIRALLVKNESFLEKVRTFAAGVVMAIVLGFILRNSSWSEMWKEIVIGSSSAFISSIWPLLERFVKSYVTKKRKRCGI